MLFSYNWIKEYIDTQLSASEVAERLTAAGIEVDGVSSEGPDIKGVVIAEIITKGSHPNADRLSLCEVATPDKTYSIVCGAANMKAGDKVALAPVGAILPGGHKLKKSKIRGVASEGMMCSEVELGLAEESGGIMILPEDSETGQDLVTALGSADSMLDADILPN
ncbi:Phenylalanyl-tRNA synthetase beta chain, partial [hydrothermal vent metagenome]